MASRNPDANANQPGEFGAHKPRNEPMRTTGHKPGVNVGNDAAPEFHAKTLPPGSAPKESTYEPNSTSETPGQADNANVLRSHGKESTYTPASATLGGTTSAAVHTGYGHPGQGQTSSELRHDGGHSRSKQGTGLVGVGASGASAGNQQVDERTQEGQRGLEREYTGSKGGADKGPAAEEREAESA